MERVEWSRTVEPQHGQRVIPVQRAGKGERAVVRDAVIRQQQVRDAAVELDRLGQLRGTRVADLVGTQVQLTEAGTVGAYHQGAKRERGPVTQGES